VPCLGEWAAKEIFGCAWVGGLPEDSVLCLGGLQRRFCAVPGWLGCRGAIVLCLSVCACPRMCLQGGHKDQRGGGAQVGGREGASTGQGTKRQCGAAVFVLAGLACTHVRA